MSLVLKILFSILFFEHAHALDIRIDSDQLTPKEFSVSNQATRQVLALLPASFHQNLGRVRIQFVTTEDWHMGRAQRGLIQINRALLDLSRTTENKASRHRDSWTLLLATMIHEIAHLYDLANLPDPDTLSYAHQCHAFDDIQQADPLCQNLKSRTRSISQNLSFLKAAGWWINAENNQLRQGNFFEARSPDYYEFKSPEESFAVNMEFFLLDPEFKCRKSVLYKNLARLLNHDPSPIKSCNQFTFQVLAGSRATGNDNPLTEIPFNRLYQIHWLHAGEGSATMSRFGHSMLRLVICDPRRKQVGPECLSDVRHHLVLTYRGSIEESSIDSIKGLRGFYPSILFVQSFSATRNEYNRDEFRNLYSYPLRLSRDEMLSVLESALEAHWSYEGKYYFLSNNCAVETLNLLKRSYPFDSPIQSIHSVRPDSLVSLLKSQGLFDLTSVRGAAPYFYPSLLPHYREALNSLQKQGTVPSDVSLSSWVQVPPQIREEWLSRIIKLKNRSLIGGFFDLEVRAASQLSRKIKAQVSRKVEESLQTSSSKQKTLLSTEESKILNEMRFLLAQIRSAGHIVGNTGYGRPLQSEVDTFFSLQKAQNFLESSKSTMKRFNKIITQNQTDEMRLWLNQTNTLIDRSLEAMGLNVTELKEILDKIDNNVTNKNQKEIL